MLEILGAGEARAPRDFYHAAFMCHHAAADQVSFYEAANHLALVTGTPGGSGKTFFALLALSASLRLTDLQNPSA